MLRRDSSRNGVSTTAPDLSYLTTSTLPTSGIHTPVGAGINGSTSSGAEPSTSLQATPTAEDDLFFNLAQDEDASPSAGVGVKQNGRSERRRSSRFGFASLRQAIPGSNFLSSSSRPKENVSPRPLTAGAAETPSNSRSSPSNKPVPPLPKEAMAAAARYAEAEIKPRGVNRHLSLQQNNHHTPSPSTENESSTDMYNYRQRRASNAESNRVSQNRLPLHRLNPLPLPTYDAPSSTDSPADYTLRARKPLPVGDGTESVASAAPSTVWDELDHLKSRIKSLERSGTMPQLTNHSTPSNERPRTATTTVTTISSSPRHRRKSEASPIMDQNLIDSAAHTHPLLHSALYKAKSNVNQAVYRALEAAAVDALSLAAFAGSNQRTATGYTSPTISTTSQLPDRQLRRKADNLTRSLTELCVALSDTSLSNAATSPLSATRATFRPVSRDASSSGYATAVEHNRAQTSHELVPPTSSHGRPGSQGPPGPTRESPSRALSRIEARRTSAALSIPPLSPRDGRESTPSTITARDTDPATPIGGTGRRSSLSFAQASRNLTDAPNSSSFTRTGTSLLRSQRLASHNLSPYTAARSNYAPSDAGADGRSEAGEGRPISRAMTDVRGLGLSTPRGSHPPMPDSASLLAAVKQARRRSREIPSRVSTTRATDRDEAEHQRKGGQLLRDRLELRRSLHVSTADALALGNMTNGALGTPKTPMGMSSTLADRLRGVRGGSVPVE